MQTTAKQLRRGTGAVVRALRRGEKVTLTYRGKPVARMTPIEAAEPADKSGLFGIWKDNPAAASVERYMDKVRRGRFA